MLRPCAAAPCKAPRHPLTGADAPRVWNTQLLRFAAYRLPDSGKILGDPANLKFTDMLIEKMHWKPPARKTEFDVLPLVLQRHQEEPPSLFEIPTLYSTKVPITHPTTPRFNALAIASSSTISSSPRPLLLSSLV